MATVSSPAFQTGAILQEIREKVEANEPGPYGKMPLGFSRGYWKWDIQIPVREVPVGYIFEVITQGYGAMPDHAAQIPPADRWRIIAYVKTLQMSMRSASAGAWHIF